MHMHVTGYKNTTKIVVYLTFNFSIVYSTSSCMRSSFSLRAYDFCKNEIEMIAKMIFEKKISNEN